jgi:DNA-binding NtrC family response regulator
MPDRILIVDDEDVFRRNLREYLEEEGFGAEGAETGEEALELVDEYNFAVALVDIRLPDVSGVDLLERLAAEQPDTAVILMTAYASVETAVEGFRKGAYDYVLKPVVFEDIRHKIENVLRHAHLERQVHRLRREIQERLGFEGLIAESEEMEEIFELIDKVAEMPTTVLITGESGTGKELVARAIHERSNRSDRQFLAVNTAAIPEGVTEAQLFGSEKAAFTGATEKREGIFRSARGGTVFLDEIGEIPLDVQAKLLRTLEQHEVMPVGASEPIEVDFRLIAATNQDLEELVEEGAFREDLFYRLDIFRIELPALRERRTDVAPLVEHFAEMHARKLGCPVPAFSNRAMTKLMSYDWPGNVRELSNVVERALILAEDKRVEVDDLPDMGEESEAAPTLALDEVVEEAEKKHIQQVLQMTGGNKTKAAELLEIDPATLYRRISKYDLE